MPSDAKLGHLFTYVQNCTWNATPQLQACCMSDCLGSV